MKLYLLFLGVLFIPVQGTASACSSFGQASPFLVYAANLVLFQNGMIQGGIAGKQVDLSYLSVGGATEVCERTFPSDGTKVSVISLISTSLNHVSLRYGHAVSRGQITQQTSDYQVGCQQLQYAEIGSILDFSQTSLQLQALSNGLRQLDVGDVTVAKGDLLLLLTASDSPLHVFTFDATVFSTVKNIMLVEILDTTSTVVINVLGSKVSLKNINMQDLNARRNQILWNFPEATEIQLEQFTFYGTILAPNSLVYCQSSIAVIYGAVYANTLTGTMMIYRSFFSACSNLPATFNATTPIVSNPPTVPTATLSISSSPPVVVAPSPSVAPYSDLKVRLIQQSQWQGGFYFQINMQRTTGITGYISLSVSFSTPSSDCLVSQLWQSDGQQPSTLTLPLSLRIFIRDSDITRDIAGGQINGQSCQFTNLNVAVTGFQTTTTVMSRNGFELIAMRVDDWGTRFSVQLTAKRLASSATTTWGSLSFVIKATNPPSLLAQTSSGCGVRDLWGAQYQSDTSSFVFQLNAYESQRSGGLIIDGCARENVIVFELVNVATG